MADYLTVEQLPGDLATRYRDQRHKIANIRRFEDGMASAPITAIKISWINLTAPHKWKSADGVSWVAYGDWCKAAKAGGNVAAEAPADVEERAAAIRERARPWR